MPCRLYTCPSVRDQQDAADANDMNTSPEPIVWTAPSRDSSGSMPLSNGDIGLNVWIEDDGVHLSPLGNTHYANLVFSSLVKTNAIHINPVK